jgi:hypothetical protein
MYTCTKKAITLGLILLGLFLFLPNKVQAYPFDVTSDFGVSANPRGVVAADFNNDGRTDVAVAANRAAGISVLLSNGYGSLDRAVDYGVVNNPWGIAAADFDGDGFNDIVVSSDSDNSISVFLNDGDGTFATPVTYRTGNDARGLAVGDFNGDGNKDVVVTNISDDTVSVLLGNGDGTLQAKRDYATNLDPASVVVDDFNNDGVEDLAVGDTNASNIFPPTAPGWVSILTGRGDGSFNAKRDFVTTRGATEITSGDFNGDGYKDVAVAKRESNNAGVLLGNGDGTLQAVVNYSAGSYPGDIIAADITSNGILDLVVVNTNGGTISFLTGGGDGTFRAQTTSSAASNPTSIATADFNQDGKLDLIVSNNGADSVRMYLDSSLPTISSISPDNATAGEGGKVVTITGTGFEPDSRVAINGSHQAATFVSTTQVQTTIGASDLVNAGTLNIQVYNPATDEHTVSAAFTIAAAPPVVGGGGLPGAAFSSPSAPEGGFKVVINSGALSTADKNVSLKFIYQPANEPKAARFAVSNGADFTSASIMDLSRFNSDAYPWDICTNLVGSSAQSCSAGKHTVYVKFYTSWGRASEAVSASINYSTAFADKISGVNTGANLSGFVFTRVLRLGDSGSDVKKLQEFLNAKGFTVSQSGPGSAGNETTFFGRATEAAVKKFQEAYADQILTPLGLKSGTGIFGAATRKMANSLL